MRSTVYIMQLVGTDFYKIGYSSDPERRLKELKLAMGRKICIFMTRETDFAPLIENDLHKTYSFNLDSGNEFSCPTEWFKFTEDEILKVCTEIDKRVIHAKERRRERIMNSVQ